MQTCWGLKIYCPKEVLAFFLLESSSIPLTSQRMRRLLVAVEWKGVCLSLVNQLGLLGPLQIENLNCTALHQPLVLQIQRLLYTQAGNSEFCGTGLFVFISFVTSLTYRGRGSLKFFLLHDLKAVSDRYKSFSAHFFTLFLFQKKPHIVSKLIS